MLFSYTLNPHRKAKASFIWSRVPETTLTPSYRGRANISPVSLKSSTNRLHEDHQLVSGRRDNSPPELSHLGRQGNPGRRDNFFSYKHFVSPTRDDFLRATCHVTSVINKMYTEEEKFRQTEPTVIKSPKILKEKGVLRS